MTCQPLPQHRAERHRGTEVTTREATSAAPSSPRHVVRSLAPAPKSGKTSTCRLEWPRGPRRYRSGLPVEEVLFADRSRSSSRSSPTRYDGDGERGDRDPPKPP